MRGLKKIPMIEPIIPPAELISANLARGSRRWDKDAHAVKMLPETTV